MMNALDSRTTNALWASVCVETLSRAGVRRAVISPGSRSTPLTIALARHPEIQATPVLDERSAAFFALGMAKATLEPVVLLCTSGTAGANYFPAIIEAHESGVPLIVITADRPPELRACASGQTIDQQKLFGSYVGFFHELAVPALDLGLFRYLRQTIVHAVTRTAVPSRGPVHLNTPFRDPLAPLPDGGAADAFVQTVDWNHFFAQVVPAPMAASAVPPLPVVADAHGVIVVGPSQPQDPPSFAAAVGEIARKLGWPVIADGLSPVRNYGDRISNVVTTYDIILRNASAAERLTPEFVLCIGGWPTSKVLRGWLESTDAATWLLTDRVDNRDALHGRTRQISTSLGALADSLPEAGGNSSYARMWLRYEERARAALDERLMQTSALFEPKAAWLLARHLPADTPVFIANSMPIRDVEYMWPINARGLRPLCNRGANGIDGTLSTALGVAHVTGRSTVLLTGDLALLHDANGFLLQSKARGSLTIVLINNAGGGIFEHLPIASFEPPFEELFATPQKVDFSQLAAAYGAEHLVIEDWQHFSQQVDRLPVSGVRVLEIRTNRKRDAALRKQWFGEIAAALS